MAADPYRVLGVKRDASQDQIQKAYRRLAKKMHPDLNPGNKKAEEQFKEVSAAYDLLGDADKRTRFDRGEIDASGTERPQQLHLDLFLSDPETLAHHHGRALALGARVLEDRFDSPEEPLYVYADHDGHPFCMFSPPG